MMEDSRWPYAFFLDRSYRWAVSLALGLFLYFFLLAFLPFGISNYNPNHRYTGHFLWEIAKFMGLTVAVAAALEVGLKPRLLKRTHPAAIGLWTLLLVGVLGVANYLLYNWLGNWHDLSLGSALEFILNCTLVFVFPLAGTFVYYRLRALRRYLQQIQVEWPEAQEPGRMLHFRGQGQQDQFSVVVTHFRYARAQDNYVEVVYFHNEELRTVLLRCPLSDLLEQAGHPALVRCHRSFVVNLHQVRSFHGGDPLWLHLEGIASPIRVSRSYRQSLLDRLRPSAPQA